MTFSIIDINGLTVIVDKTGEVLLDALLLS